MREGIKTKNIDQICAKYSIKIVEEMKFNNDPKEIQNLVTKALGVLQQQGLYALGLFCKAENKADKILEKIIEMLCELGIMENSNEKDLSNISKLSERIHDLMFAIEIVEKALIYARYHAKSQVKKQEAQSE